MTPLGAPLTPLVEAPAPKQSMLGPIVIVLLFIAVMWWLNQDKPVKANRSRIKKQSTKEMARNLYTRLDNRGGVNETTMRSLRALGAEKKS